MEATPKPVIVTRHPSVARFFIEEGYVPENTQVLSKARVEDVVGRDVFGHLPINHACRARSLTVVFMPRAKADHNFSRQEMRKATVRRFTVNETPVQWADNQ